MTYYVDASAFVKLFAFEAESDSVRTLLAGSQRPIVSSALLEIEVFTAAHRIGSDAPRLAKEFLASVERIDISRGIISIATQLAPEASLRSLDAIHLATALAVPEAVTVVTYDHRLTEACVSSGLTTLAPA
jgi:hypothetical protein